MLEGGRADDVAFAAPKGRDAGPRLIRINAAPGASTAEFN
jgi:hypothetical protein